MSVQVSYKKQVIFGIMLLLILVVVTEGIARAYEFYEPPNCVMLTSDSFKEVSPFLVRQICLDMTQVMYEEKGEQEKADLMQQKVDELNKKLNNR